MKEQQSVIYRIFTCQNDHSWDAYGYLRDSVTLEQGLFVPEGTPKIYFCPECGEKALYPNGTRPDELS